MRRERFQRQKRLQEAWETLRWISKYVEENSELWEIEKLEREVERRKKIEEWEKLKRFERIEYLRSRDKRKREGIKEVDDMDKSWIWSEWKRGEKGGKKEGRKPEEEDKIEVETSEDMWPKDRINYTFSLKEPKIIVMDEFGNQWDYIDNREWGLAD